MKTFSVLYATTTSYEAVVKAKTKEEAKNKVLEVIGSPVKIEKVFEIRKVTENEVYLGNGYAAHTIGDKPCA